MSLELPDLTDPNHAAFEQARQAAAAIREASAVAEHDLAIVLGSGWASAAEALGPAQWEVSTADLPHFSPSSVPGHGGSVRSINRADRHVLVFMGRTHLYENHGATAVAHPVRTAAASGCRSIIFTNGSGSLNPSWLPGTPVLISDHINFTAESPLLGPSFVDVTDLYSPSLRRLCTTIDPELDEGVYIQFRGPSYETPAEIRMARAMGADLVGMSTALEAIAARHAGMEILGISLVTNLAAGMTGEALNHQEVLDNGTMSAHRIGNLLAAIVDTL
jgi:purine-nucleoside phosphorylase